MSSLGPQHHTQHLDATWGNRTMPGIQENAPIGHDNINSIGTVLEIETHIAHSENYDVNKASEFATDFLCQQRATQRPRDNTTGHATSLDAQGSAQTAHKQAAKKETIGKQATHKHEADNRHIHLPEIGFQWDAKVRHGPIFAISEVQDLLAKNESDGNNANQ